MSAERFSPVTTMLIALTALFIHTSDGIAQSVMQWRGIARDGIYHETNLLKSWPETGPGQILKIDRSAMGLHHLL